MSAGLKRALAQAALSDADVKQMMALMDAAGIRQQAEQEAETHGQHAMRALQQIGTTNAAGEILAELAGSLTRREK